MFKDLNKHLMMQLDRLTSIQDEDLKDTIEDEAKRAKAIVNVSKQVVEVGNTVIEAQRLALDYNISVNEVLQIKEK